MAWAAQYIGIISVIGPILQIFLHFSVLSILDRQYFVGFMLPLQQSNFQLKLIF